MKEKANPDRKSILNLRAFLLAILSLYSIFCIYHFFSSGIISNDGVKYVEIARALLTSSHDELGEVGFFNTYSSTIATLFLLTGDWEVSGKIASSLFGLMTVLALYLFLEGLLGRRQALVISFLFGISPTFIRLSNDILRETLFLFLFTSALLSAYEGIRSKRLRFFIFSSVLTALSILTRLEGLLLFILVPILFYLQSAGRREFVKALGTYFLSFLLFYTSSLFLPQDLKTGIRKNPVEMKVEELINKRGEDSSRSVESTRTETYLILKLSKGFYEVSSDLFKALGPLYVLLIFFGIFERSREDQRFFFFWFFSFFFVSIAFFYFFDYFSLRHGFLLGIPTLFWAYKGVLKLEKKMPVILILLLIVVFSLPQNLRPLRMEKHELKLAGEMIRSMGITDEKIATTMRLGRVVFYSGNLTFGIEKFSGIDILREEMKKRKIRYLLIDHETMRKFGGEKTLWDSGFERVQIPGSERLKRYKLLLFRIEDS